MKPNDLLFLSIKSLSSNPLRFFLSSLGVFMGVFAISGTLQVSDVGKTFLKKQLEEMESPQIVVYSPSDLVTYQSKKYQPEDLEWLKKSLSGWSYIAPLENGSNNFILYGNQKIAANSQAVTPEFLRITGRKLILGNFFTFNDLQQKYPVVVIDQLVAQNLFKGKNPLDKMIYFQDKSYYIKGVIQSKASSYGSEKEGLILIPLSVYQAVISNPFFEQIIITPTRSEDLDKVKIQAIKLLKKRFTNLNIDAYSNIQQMKKSENLLNQVTIILLLIGGIALIVGGVGIANISIASVVERTPEIGLRRAIGASQKDILIQFLLEATIISVVGGIIAIATVQGITILAVNILNLPYEFNYQTPLISLNSAMVVGIISSFLPALRASKLDPVESLRSQ
ncbi:ABC transporter permease [Cylindrospermum sp. FACHB-282]|uniref:ABC transporter permease n=1 Tax=Cylindrospermum sp. FACHB-282 TaxID=2692794 RepID=UPI001682576E|nr:ABC transporter permease [Cylindrospermum sp. FACHB-282]MBD2384608.1 ABC transporter permease [Cylindrospermum sp. FACHB-282]